MIATIWYVKECASNMRNDYTDIYALLYFGTPYVIFWLVYLLILHW
jgi:hypothetical protein